MDDLQTHDVILEKLASASILNNPEIQDLLQRVREVGLHKVACTLYRMPELSVKTAALHLGTAMVYRHNKYKKIASGLASFEALSNTETLEKLADFGSAKARLLGLVKGLGTKAAPTPSMPPIPGISNLEAMGKANPNFHGGLAAPPPESFQRGEAIASRLRNEIVPALQKQQGQTISYPSPAG